MADHRPDRAPAFDWPSPEMADRLVRLLVAELGALRDRALAAGARPEHVATTVDERLRRLRGTVPPRDEPGR